MSEITLAYGIGHATRHKGFYPRLINATEDKIEKLAFEPHSGALMLLSRAEDKNNPNPFSVIDVFYPNREFVTALRDQANDDCRLLSRVAVDELARNIMKIAEHQKVTWIEAVTLEVSDIRDFTFVKRDAHGQYIYRVTLENGWHFTLIVLSEREPEAMTKIGHTDKLLGIDDVMIELFPQARSHAKHDRALKETYQNALNVYCLKRVAMNLDTYRGIN